MIHDPIIEVSCDHCFDTIEITPSYKYTDYSGNTGYYDCSDESIMDELTDAHEWIVVGDDNLTFCCEACCKDYFRENQDAK